MIPNDVQRDDLMTALAPLGALLGVDIKEVIAPLVICPDSITLTVGAGADTEMAGDATGNDFATRTTTSVVEIR